MPQVDLAHLDLSPAHLKILQQLLVRYVPGVEVWAYGSRVNATAHEGSDLDLVLRYPSDAESEMGDCLDLKEALQESTLPMRVEMHLWSHLPSTFYPEIERRYIVLQEAAD